MLHRLYIMILLCVLGKECNAYDGEGTYYGNGGAGSSGSCMLPRNFNGIATTVAMNAIQYEGGAACGRCVMVRGDGVGVGMTPILGPIYATIDNVCSECKFGDIDLAMNGDGRYLIEWNFIDCHDIPRAFRRNLRHS